ncbi:MAG: endolytic transglycosylase MltG [Lachnospiraceae bacterium]|nr:endolytic transglycosylase MltG [Lachnospiraceae bacterium]
MSQMTKEINAITGTIIGVSGKLIIYALVILLLVEGMTRGYAFGHEVFYATAMEPEPGVRYALTIPEGQDAAETARVLKDVGLIRNEYAVRIQMWFYDYEVYPGTYELSTAMTSKEILQQLNVKPETGGGSAAAAETSEVPDEEAEDGGERISIEEEPEAGSGEEP